MERRTRIVDRFAALLPRPGVKATVNVVENIVLQQEGKERENFLSVFFKPNHGRDETHLDQETFLPDDYPTAESLVAAWNKVEGYVREFLSTLKDEDLARPIEYTFGRSEGYSTPLGDLMHHAAIHGAHHRGQVALLLSMLRLVSGTNLLLGPRGLALAINRSFYRP